jgi:DNA-binding MarR family transcriptional regulator
MPHQPEDHIEVEKVAEALYLSISLFVRRLRQTKRDDAELTLPESSALSRLDRGGPATSAALARTEQISPQSMGTTLAALEARGLVSRDPDPADGRRAVMSVTEAGLEVLRNRRTARAAQFADALAAGFTSSELEQLMVAAPLIEKLAQSI